MLDVQMAERASVSTSSVGYERADQLDVKRARFCCNGRVYGGLLLETLQKAGQLGAKWPEVTRCLVQLWNETAGSMNSLCTVHGISTSSVNDAE